MAVKYTVKITNPDFVMYYGETYTVEFNEPLAYKRPNQIKEAIAGAMYWDLAERRGCDELGADDTILPADFKLIKNK
jgi:hypothetical protein